MKLFIVKLRGLGTTRGIDYSKSYVVADDTDEAYKIVRKFLNDKDYGFSKERELSSVELIADENEFTDVMTRLFIK